MRQQSMLIAIGAFLIGSNACSSGFDALTSVTDLLPASITVVASAPSLVVGQTAKVAATVMDASGHVMTSASVSWENSAPAVASVSSDGTVSALSSGTATLTAASGTAKGEVTISVSAAPGSSTPPPAGAPPVTLPASSPALLPTSTVETSMPSAPAPGGTVVSVPAGADLQAAINLARPGDVIELARCATYVGAFTLPNKGLSASWIIIRPASSVVLPAAGTRMTPTLAASLCLPKIVSADAGYAISTSLGAHHYRLVGLEITTGATLSQSYGLVGFGGDASQGQRSLIDVAHDLILDRAYVHGTPTMPLRRCVALNSGSAAIIDSWLSECHDRGADAQAIAGWNGPGPFLIRNNRLEASTEIIMFGGSDAAAAELSPADITIRGNFLTKPIEWKNGPWLIKTIFELKNAKRVLVEGNVLEHNWPQAWQGQAVSMKSVNQDNTAPWSGTTDVTFRGNLIRGIGGGFNLHSSPEGKPAVPMARVSITNNIVLGINSPDYPGFAQGFFLGGSIADLTIDHNTLTWVGLGRVIDYEGDPPQPFARTRITDNLFATVGGVGLIGQGIVYPGTVWAAWAPGGLMAGNAFGVGREYFSTLWNSFNAGNQVFVNDNTLFTGFGFVNGAAGDVRLTATSPLKGTAINGGDPGADVAAVMAAANVAISGVP